MEIFLKLFSPKWKDKLDKMNGTMDKHNSSEKGEKGKQNLLVF
jgi:hypothetical protein